MELTSKQRAKLRSMAQKEEPIVHIGKGGITDQVCAQTEEALVARELIKCTVQQNSEFSAREAADLLCEKVGAFCVGVIGRRFIIYRENAENKKINL